MCPKGRHRPQGVRYYHRPQLLRTSELVASSGNLPFWRDAGGIILLTGGLPPTGHERVRTQGRLNPGCWSIP